ncbi:MAG TPA: diguanylate cyclase [Nevskiaceae bacterium]|nr:diguanylate cyclase [Nevskiaceae bacterium]
MSHSTADAGTDPLAPEVRVVLLVDDNAEDRYACRRYLAQEFGIVNRTEEAHDGTTGLAKARALKPACIVLDYHLPDMNGLEFMQRVRHDDPDVPIVLVTGLDDVAATVELIRNGADDYQVKSKLSADGLQRSIRMAIEQRQLRADVRRQRRKLELFYNLIDRSSDFLFVLSRDPYRVTEVNRAASRQLGWSRKEMLDASFEIERVLPGVQDGWSRLGEAGELRFECDAITRQGRVMPVEVNARAVELDGARFVVAVARDIADRRALEARLRDESLRDGLTGVANRRAMNVRMHEEWDRALRSHSPIGLLLIDVDHFKAYNDHLGHVAGDACLMAVASTLTINLRRQTDFLARYGGEEFAVILPASNDEVTERTAALLLDSVRAMSHPHPVPAAGPIVTVSIGYASTIPKPGETAADLVAMADRGLYAAKEAGRNRAMRGDEPA